MWRSYNWPKKKGPAEEGEPEFRLGEVFSPAEVKSEDMTPLPRKERWVEDPLQPSVPP